MQQVVLVRHGETDWSEIGRHTGRTNLELTERGAHRAERLAPRLRAWAFTLVLTSPLRRALETCRVAGFADRAVARADLMEWNYGEYEGLTTAEIHATRPGWVLWLDGALGGETPGEVGARADRIIAEIRTTPGDVLIFSHGDLLRALGARWLGLPTSFGRLFKIRTAALSVLGYERGDPVLLRWNDTAHLQEEPADAATAELMKSR
jgi:broad specificity phosphatase PhoE